MCLAKVFIWVTWGCCPAGPSAADIIGSHQTFNEFVSLCLPTSESKKCQRRSGQRPTTMREPPYGSQSHLHYCHPYVCVRTPVYTSIATERVERRELETKSKVKCQRIKIKGGYDSHASAPPTKSNGVKFLHENGRKKNIMENRKEKQMSSKSSRSNSSSGSTSRLRRESRPKLTKGAAAFPCRQPRF